jgi:hypothetical protein
MACSVLRSRAGAANFKEWYGTIDRFRQGVFAGVRLTWDDAKKAYSYSTPGYYPADGLQGGVRSAYGHNSYFTTAMQV